jgi:hypothetical protein
MASFKRSRQVSFIEAVSRQQAVAPTLEIKSRDLFDQYSANPKFPLRVDDISKKFVVFCSFLAFIVF